MLNGQEKDVWLPPRANWDFSLCLIAQEDRTRVKVARMRKRETDRGREARGESGEQSASNPVVSLASVWMSAGPWSTDKASARREREREDGEEKDVEEKEGSVLLNWEAQNTLHKVQIF